MPETIYRKIEEVYAFMQELGYDQETLPAENVLEVYPGYFPDRRVFRIYDREVAQERVVKIRPNDQAARTEVEKLSMLLKHYGLNGFKVREKGNYLLFDMPWMGYNLNRLATELDIRDYETSRGTDLSASELFAGFTANQVEDLLQAMQVDNQNLLQKTALIHGDMYQHGFPNNIVYHPGLNRLHLIDAEGLAEATPERIAWYQDQLSQVRDWMFSSLVEE
jgi:hypothetical protein